MLNVYNYKNSAVVSILSVYVQTIITGYALVLQAVTQKTEFSFTNCLNCKIFRDLKRKKHPEISFIYFFSLMNLRFDLPQVGNHWIVCAQVLKPTIN